MYEVAVLEAGSAAVSEKMDGRKRLQVSHRHGQSHRRLCRTLAGVLSPSKPRSARKSGVDPQPGQRTVKPELPAGSVFDGNVQGMGFRFKSEKLVVPMRLSAFNDGESAKCGLPVNRRAHERFARFLRSTWSDRFPGSNSIKT